MSIPTTHKPPEQPSVRIKFLKQYKELFNPYWRNIVFHGGRASGKSQHVGLALVLRGREKKLRILCTREIQKTIADSVHKLLKDIIDSHNFTDYVVTDKAIRNTITGTEFIFSGLRHNVNEIKSMEGIDIAWVEEAQSITEASLKVLSPTIRKEGSQLIFTFNRLNELDPVYVRYVMQERAKTYIAKVNFDVLMKAGLLPETIRMEMEEDKASPETFAHVWLGEPLAQTEMSIINRNMALEAMQRQTKAVGGIEIGVDVARMGGDRSVFWKRKGLTTIGTETYSQLRLTDLADRLEDFAEFKKNKIVKGVEQLGTLIKIDDTGVGGGLTDIMIQRGYNVMAINFGSSASDPDKYPNWISEAWFYMTTILEEAELPLDDDLLMELTTRQWKQDNKGRRAVESKGEYKKRGYRSPDKADACIICYYTPEPKLIEWASPRF